MISDDLADMVRRNLDKLPHHTGPASLLHVRDLEYEILYQHAEEHHAASGGLDDSMFNDEHLKEAERLFIEAWNAWKASPERRKKRIGPVFIVQDGHVVKRPPTPFEEKQRIKRRQRAIRFREARKRLRTTPIEDFLP